MQTLSWDEVIKRVDGVPYHIDFYQDFSEVRAGEIVPDDMLTIVNAILSPPEPPALPAREEHYLTPKDWEKIDKQVRKEAKAEARSNKVPVKKAMKKLNKARKKLGVND